VSHPAARVALETTLLLHGVPRAKAPALARALASDVRDAGGIPCVVGVVEGRPIADLPPAALRTLLATPAVPKLNTSTLGAALAAGSHGATTVSTTMEIAAAAGIRLFATGGIGGVHQGFASHLDISADLAAFTRFPVAVVASGCKSILDVTATRELLEAAGVPVIGFRTDRFPAFYLRDGGVGVDRRFDDPAALAAFLRAEMARTARGVLVVNPIPGSDEIPRGQWTRWLDAARADPAVRRAEGRYATPALLAALHAVSKGATLRANIALVRANARLAAQIAVAWAKQVAPR